MAEALRKTTNPVADYRLDHRHLDRRDQRQPDRRQPDSVLDKLIEDGRVDVDAVAATGAGARAALEDFWRAMRAAPACLTPGQRAAVALMFDQPVGTRWLEYVTQVMSPYEFNPLNFDPVRDLRAGPWRAAPIAGQGSRLCARLHSWSSSSRHGVHGRCETLDA